MKRSLLFFLATLLLAPAVPTRSARASEYPTRPLRFIVPFPPGGGADTLARVVSAGIGEILGQQVVIDNRAGAGGNIAAELAARAAPDGYTLLQTNIAHAISATVYRKLGYDLVDDFSAVTGLASTPYMLLIAPTLKAPSVKEVIAYAKRHPGELRYGSSGSGGSSHLAMELLKAMAGFDATHIPYKGAMPGMIDLMSGRIELMFNTLGVALNQVRSGKLRALAVSSARRFPTASEYPTIAESGVPGYEAYTWYGIMVPAGTKQEIVSQLHATTVSALRKPGLRDQLISQSYEIVGSSPADFAAHVKSEMSKWGEIVKSWGARVE
ncbi:MAG: tripartite tricarboxylate transporter substrate binding protein [Betaproteobacteria bacterium]|nr:tripartite tricarboxylate transporter substrate binding protein [Betaproteobacteria bacterium]